MGYWVNDPVTGLGFVDDDPPGLVVLQEQQLYETMNVHAEARAAYEAVTPQALAVINGKWIIRIMKEMANSPAVDWVNSYEVLSPVTVALSGIVTVAAALMEFERRLHLITSRIVGYTVSTWTPDGTPYNPNSFMSKPVNVLGARFPAGDPEALEVTAFIRKAVSAGHSGRQQYRGVLTEEDLTADAGEEDISGSSGAGSTVADFATAKGAIAPYLTGGSSGSKLALISKDGTNVRPVDDIVLAKASIVKRNHKWFDRA